MKYLFGNWKMNLTRSEARALAHNVALHRTQNSLLQAIFPPSIWLEVVKEALSDSRTQFGAQSCYSADKGAFTGETSPKMIAEIGAKWCLVGHSERRRIFSESNEESALRCAAAVQAGLQPVICVGESSAEQSAGATEGIVRAQLIPCLAAFARTKQPQAYGEMQCVIAYEPVWSIGTGKVPTHDQISRIISILRDETGGQFPVLYGGSVTADNARNLASIPGVDGFLVGGASLDAGKFAVIGEALI